MTAETPMPALKEYVSTEFGLSNLVVELGKSGVSDAYIIHDTLAFDVISLPKEEFLIRNVRLEDVKSLPKGSTIILTEKNPAKLSAQLVAFAGECYSRIYFPVTSSFYKFRTVFFNGVPKSGNHLLMEVLSCFGFEIPHGNALSVYKELSFNKKTAYSLQHSAPDILSQPLDYSSVYRAFVDVFARSTHLFIFRDPDEVLVSLKHYLSGSLQYHALGKYFHGLDEIEQLERLATGKYPIPIFINEYLKYKGNIRDLFFLYLDWFDLQMPNFVGIKYGSLNSGRSFENIKAVEQSVWFLQLALHVPGSPREFALRIKRKSLTFREGASGVQPELSPIVSSLLDKYDWHFYDSFYEFNKQYVSVDGSANYGEFVNKYSEDTLTIVRDGNVPVLIETFPGVSVVGYCNKFYVVDKDIGEFDFSMASPDTFSEFVSNGFIVEHEELDHALGNAAEMQYDKDLRAHPNAISLQSTGTVLSVEGFLDFNVVQHCGCWYGFAQAVGPLDIDSLDAHDFETLKNKGQCVTGESLADVKSAIVIIVMQKQLGAIKAQQETIGTRFEADLGAIKAQQETIGTHFEAELGAIKAQQETTGMRFEAELGAIKAQQETIGTHFEAELGAIKAQQETISHSPMFRLGRLIGRLFTWSHPNS